MKLTTFFQKPAVASFGLAFLSFALYRAALPAVGWKFAIFLVPAFWAVLALRDDFYRRFDRKASAKSAASVVETTRPFGGLGRRWGRLATVGAARFATRLFFGGPYRRYWSASFLFWLATVVWISYPHPATTLGWIALSGYLAFYFPLFIGMCRVLIRGVGRFRIPIWAAAPVAWTAVEWGRNRALGGFSFAGLSHALYDSPYWIQFAAPLGEYGVGAAVVFVGTLLGLGVFGRKKSASEDSGTKEGGAICGARFVVGYWLVAAAALGAIVYFGRERVAFFDKLERFATERGEKPFRIALLQDGTTYRFPVPERQNRQVEENYLTLAAQASRSEPAFDAIVWPESCFGGFYPDFSFDSKRILDPISIEVSRSASNDAANGGGLAISPDFDADAALADLTKRRRAAARATARIGTAAILGTTSVAFDENGATTFYNSAVFAPYFGDLAGVASLPDAVFNETPTNAPAKSENSALPEFPPFRRYDKIRLVMFGEYIPFVEFLPDRFPLKAVCADFALGRGAGPTAFELPRRADFQTSAGFVAESGSGALILAPNVCFESSIPHFIKSQVRDLAAVGAEPDVLVNVSNDGWFRNGIQTDMHLATQVFRALETGKTVVSATHGGFSAWVDPAGRIRSRGKRGASEVVSAEILRVPYRRAPIYWGEIFAAACAALGFGALVFAAIRRKIAAFRASLRRISNR